MIKYYWIFKTCGSHSLLRGEIKPNDISIRMNEGDVLGIVGKRKREVGYGIFYHGLTAHPGRIISGTSFSGHRIDRMTEKCGKYADEVSIIFRGSMTSLVCVYNRSNSRSALSAYESG